QHTSTNKELVNNEYENKDLDDFNTNPESVNTKYTTLNNDSNRK
ncbi:DUF948 domain-containing protein, partial [Staphylococcus chromogenes]